MRAEPRGRVIGGYLSLLVGAQLPVDANSPISIREFCGGYGAERGMTGHHPPPRLNLEYALVSAFARTYARVDFYDSFGS